MELAGPRKTVIIVNTCFIVSSKEKYLFFIKFLVKGDVAKGILTWL